MCFYWLIDWLIVAGQASYINERLAARDDTSDDEDGYVQPNTTNHPRHKHDDDDDNDDDDDDIDDDNDIDDNDSDDADKEEDASECNTLNHGRRRRNKKYHDYINVLQCHC